MKIKIQVEPQRKKTNIMQCYMCQFFRHNQSRRQQLPKCVQCANSHFTKNLPHPKRQIQDLLIDAARTASATGGASRSQRTRNQSAVAYKLNQQLWKPESYRKEDTTRPTNKKKNHTNKITRAVETLKTFFRKLDHSYDDEWTLDQNTKLFSIAIPKRSFSTPSFQSLSSFTRWLKSFADCYTVNEHFS